MPAPQTGTVVYNNAQLLINGADVSTQLTELSIAYSAEMLDQTTFGNDTRIAKGGLFKGAVSGKGYVGTAQGLESVVFGGIPNGSSLTANPAYESGAVIEDTILVVFPDGVTEGAIPGSAVGTGYAMKGVLDKFDFGGPVGSLLALAFEAQSRGIGA